MGKNRAKTKQKMWRPLMPATLTGRPEVMAAYVRSREAMDSRIYKNDQYQVQVRRIPREGWWPCDVIHLSVKRLDRKPVHDWRDLQRIKNELVGPEHEAVELYPRESRLTDSANQYHLWVLADPDIRFPFGYDERLVADGNGMGTKQRPWREDERPADCVKLDEEEFRRRAAGK